MKQISAYILGILWCLIALTACNREPEPTSITLSASVITLSIGQDTIIEAMVSPQSTPISWKSEFPDVARVTSGVVTAVSEGVTTIVAYVDGAQASCTVIVIGNEPIDDNLSDAIRYLPRSSKRGVGFSSPFYPEDVTILAHTISWAYNWGPAPSAAIGSELDSYQIDFIPMAWNASYNKERIREYVQAHPNCRYLLAYNEPNLTDQANMTPQQVATTWPALKAFAKENGLLLVAPAMNYGTLADYSDPVKWLDDFFECEGVSINDVAALALHCYMGSAGAMKSFINRFDKYGKPIWMTEFCGWESPVNSASDQLRYMSEVILMQEKDSRVERYAWFLARGNGSIDNKPWNQLLTKTEPSTLSHQGLIYEGLSSLDSSVWLNPGRHILMNTCSDVCSLADSEPIASPHFLPTEDFGQTLYMSSFLSGKWVEYQIEAPSSYATLRLRARAYMPTTISIIIDNLATTSITIPRSQDEQWATYEFPINLSSGKHTLRMQVTTGNCDLHWFQLMP